MILREVSGVPLSPGKVKLVAKEAIGAETINWAFPIDSDTVLISLFVTTLSVGTLDVSVYTYAETGKELEIIKFPQLSGPTSSLLIEKAAVALSNIRIEVTASDGAEIDIRAKGLTLGESSTRILGATDARASQTTVTNIAGVLLASSFTDRTGIILKNNGGGTLYLGYSLAEATTTDGYPIGAGESIAIDIASGVTVYAVGTANIDVRIMEAGG